MTKSDGTIESIRLWPSPTSSVVVKEVTYWSGGYRVKGFLAYERRRHYRGGILYLRGGIQSIGNVRPGRLTQFATKGYVVFAPFYRGNRGGEGKDYFVGEDRMDAVIAAYLLKRWIEDGPLHVIGYSRGGAVALALAAHPIPIQTIISWGGMTDIVATYKERLDMRRMMKRLIGATPNKPSFYRSRYFLTDALQTNARFLFIHGEQDRHVSLKQAEQAALFLEAHRKKVDRLYFPNETHAFSPQMNRSIVHYLTEVYFLRNSSN